MKRIYLLRHAEKDASGVLTNKGEEDAKKLGMTLPKFSKVFSSPSSRAKRTAELLTGQIPLIKDEVGFYMAPQAKSDKLNELASELGITFLEAVKQYDDTEVNAGVDSKAIELNEFIDNVFQELGQDENALIVSHDLSISPAMEKRGILLESIPFLGGYVIDENGAVSRFKQ